MSSYLQEETFPFSMPAHRQFISSLTYDTSAVFHRSVAVLILMQHIWDKTATYNAVTYEDVHCTCNM